MLNSLFAVRQRVQIWSSNSNSRGTQCDRFEYIRASLEPSVDVDFDFVEDIGAYAMEFEENEYAGLRAGFVSFRRAKASR